MESTYILHIASGFSLLVFYCINYFLFVHTVTFLYTVLDFQNVDKTLVNGLMNFWGTTYRRE